MNDCACATKVTKTVVARSSRGWGGGFTNEQSGNGRDPLVDTLQGKNNWIK